GYGTGMMPGVPFGTGLPSIKHDTIQSLGERRVLDRGMSQLSRELFYSKSMANIGDAEQLIRESVFAT
ncbi:hypothetical protein ACFPZL_13335, partial [Leucobacter soli]